MRKSSKMVALSPDLTILACERYAGLHQLTVLLVPYGDQPSLNEQESSDGLEVVT